MLRVWVNTEKYPREIYRGFRHLIHRQVDEYLGDNNWKTIHVNKTCMRNIEIKVLDEAYTRFI